MYDVFDICRYFINECNDKDIIISEMKLQCFLFLAKGYTYAFDGKELFKDRFEKWGHQAVIPEVWKKYRGHLAMNISKEVKYEDLIINDDNHLEFKTCYFNKFDIDQPTRDILDAIIDAYKNSSATYLIKMLSEELPYASTNYKEIISEDLIKTHYIRIINEQDYYNTQHKTKGNKEKHKKRRKNMENTQNTLRKLFDWFAYHNQALEDASRYCECTGEELEEALEEPQKINEEIFQEYLLGKYKEDAMRQAEDRSIKLSDEEAMNLAQVFSKRKDCNVADNDIWDDIIAEHMRN